MRKLLLLAAVLLLQITAFSQNSKREVRAAWLTTHLSLDWPTSGDPTLTKQSKLIVMLDELKAVGINTVYFQVRGVADAFYPSALVPWSNRLTGVYGADPGWDPLAFVVNACHERGMEIHAWLNPYRAATDQPIINSYSATHKARTNPEWLLEQATTNPTTGYVTRLKYFNPALAAVRNHINDVVSELVSNYDLDGIHFDDYFYYSGLGTQDASNFSADPRGFSNINDWRRDNVTLLIQQLHISIKNLKPWVKFGISPSGIYRNFTVTTVSPNVTTTGSEHYSVQYADTKKWMQDGTIDYLVPQVYWAFSQTGANAKFNYIVDNWNSMNFNRHLLIGLATYRTKDNTSSAYTEDEIKNQINYLRNSATNTLGAAHFRAAHTVTTLTATKPTMEYIRDNQYSTPAIIPAMTWIDNVAPAEPTDLTSALEGGKTKLSWTAPVSTTDELQKVVRYAVYRSTSSNIDYNNSANLIAILPSTAITYTDNAVTPGSGTSYYYAVTSLDRISNESVASNVVPDAVTLPVKLINFAAKKDNNRVKVEWSTASEINSDYFLIEKAGADGVFRYLDKQNSSPENTAEIKNYVAIDNYPFNGTNYYRLTQFDKNGEVSKPAFTAVDFNELILVNAKAFPNPTQKEINFSLENFEGKSIKTRLINLYGQIVHEEEFNTQNGTNQYQLGIKNELPKGQYILTLSDQKFKKNIKLIVL
ncbi:family 10 glycosylhydrolase [Pedobacter ureilyticus]|uniref:Family 10 glycosylhydrolase n=1 Tax=Pedobacter ureilyticus TaxID=1393051 RepID=A0ABW9J3X1_9SPHI|nr:family 10 glycosylhydrolase [Pedobacter helvus]